VITENGQEPAAAQARLYRSTFRAENREQKEFAGMDLPDHAGVPLAQAYLGFFAAAERRVQPRPAAHRDPGRTTEGAMMRA
jgi:hypothetical protein